MSSDEASENQHDLKQKRWELLAHVNRLTDTPMIALSFVWLLLLIIDFTTGLSSLLQIVSYVIWALFVADFAIEIMIAPHKGDYLRRNWLTAVSLLLPALRVFRLFRVLRLLRAARASRSLSLIRLVTSLNRGMRSVGKTLGRRGVGYVVALTVLVTLAGAAGMYFLESPNALRQAGYVAAAQEGAGLSSYGEAVWWTAMIMTTMGSEYWPKTAEGRVLGWLLAVYAFAIFGYITATIASYFVTQDAAYEALSEASGTATNDTAQLQAEVAALRLQIEALMARLETDTEVHRQRQEEHVS
jgi:voltage-gated potassium channel